MMSILRQKREMRISMRQQTAKLSREQMQGQSLSVFAQIELFEQFRNARTVALFWSLSDELPTQEIVRRWALSKRVVLPRIAGGKMFFVEYSPGSSMKEGPHRILEPDGTARVDPGEIDLLIVPGVAFDPEGRRLGRGKGYYDTFLSLNPMTTIGVCMSHQMVDRVPSEDHDRLVDIVVCATEKFCDPYREKDHAPERKSVQIIIDTMSTDLPT